MATTKDSAPPSTRTTRHHRYDESFLLLLEEDFGIDQFSLRAAFMGVPPAPKKQVIKVCEWAESKTRDTDERGEMARAWARKRRVGTYDPRLVEEPPATYGGHEPRGV
jgi:hypothetical protein